VLLRPADAHEASALSKLALRSKGYWGYPASFLDACRAELTIDPDDVGRLRLVLAEDAGATLGFYSLTGEPPEGELGHLFVEPSWIRRGVGRRLWEHMQRSAGALGFRVVRIEADPGAVAFYEAMGARQVGAVPSGSIPGRALPLLVFEVSPRGRSGGARPPSTPGA
jgi:GNAT superfamily N-acetyltransferase